MGSKEMGVDTEVEEGRGKVGEGKNGQHSWLTLQKEYRYLLASNIPWKNILSHWNGLGTFAKNWFMINITCSWTFHMSLAIFSIILKTVLAILGPSHFHIYENL